jgi:hypothetical protein
LNGYWIFAIMAFAFPVAAYLLYLALINGRTQPTMISGPWDFVGVLFATSGFWLVGGPMVLAVFHSRWRPALLHGEMAGVASGGWSFVWALTWLVYFGLVLGFAAFFLWRRRPYTLVYNVDVPQLEDALAQVVARLGLGTARVGNRIVFQAAAEMVERELTEAVQARAAFSAAPAAVTEGPSVGQEPPKKVLAKLDLDPFPAMRNVSLHWRRDDVGIRRDVEAELSRQLAELEAPDNPAAGWFLTVASCLFSAIFLALVGFLLLSLRR